MSKKYVEFELVDRKAKTNVYSVTSKSDGEFLGRIYWYGSWRQYVFDCSVVWSHGCLQQICDFLEKLMDKRKKKKRQP